LILVCYGERRCPITDQILIRPISLYTVRAAHEQDEALN
jgi:hypothetical protein